MHELTIISGGQTGADRAALDFALRHGISHGGRCPKGRKAEDGPLDEIYQLAETDTDRYEERTRLNVRDSDGTLVVSLAAAPTGGTLLTVELARRMGKPLLHLSQQNQPRVEIAGQAVRQFVEQHDIRRLNVAGPRESQSPGIVSYVDAVLTAAFCTANEH